VNTTAAKVAALLEDELNLFRAANLVILGGLASRARPAPVWTLRQKARQSGICYFGIANSPTILALASSPIVAIVPGLYSRTAGLSGQRIGLLGRGSPDSNLRTASL
jgi:hypothetical protein